MVVQDDPAILVGNGEGCEEAFDVHQWGSSLRGLDLSLFRGGSGSYMGGRRKEDRTPVRLGPAPPRSIAPLDFLS